MDEVATAISFVKIHALLVSHEQYPHLTQYSLFSSLFGSGTSSDSIYLFVISQRSPHITK